jgi:uncharacterized protein
VKKPSSTLGGRSKTRLWQVLRTGALFLIYAYFGALTALAQPEHFGEHSSCGASKESWMDVLSQHGVRSASVKVVFFWEGNVKDVKREKIRYFREYNQTKSTEIADPSIVLSLQSSRLEDSLYKTALPTIVSIIQEEAQRSGLHRTRGFFTYSLYDDPCVNMGYFSPIFEDPEETELMREVEAHRLNRVEELLRTPDGINRQDQFGRTALFRATSSPQSRSLVSVLVAGGADPNISDNRSTTPLMNACQLGELNSVDLLLAHGAKSDVQNADGDTALIKASAAGRVGADIVAMLLTHGVTINEQNKAGQTALMAAARSGSVKTVEELVQAGANGAIRDALHRTAAMYARDSERPPREVEAIIRLLEASSRL